MRLPPLPQSLWESPTQGTQTFQELAVWADLLLVQDGPQSRVLGRLLGSMLRAPQLTMELLVDGGSSSVSLSMRRFRGQPAAVSGLVTTNVIVRCAGHHLDNPGGTQWGPSVGSSLAGSVHRPLQAWEARHDYRYDVWNQHYDSFTWLTLYPQRLDLVEDE